MNLNPEITKKNFTIGLIVIILIVVGIVYYKKHQKNISECKEDCIYYPESRGIIMQKGWNYKNRVFETQNQCIDYCLTIK